MHANDALEKLKQGNLQFLQATSAGKPLLKNVSFEDMSQAQKPFAVILGCSDSRVPAEMVFDQGFGDLFVIRVAGNIVAPSQIGSIEFACQTFGTQLVVVLGHTQCGAVQATVDSLKTGSGAVSPNLKSIIERVEPAVAPVVQEHGESSNEQLMSLAGRANVAMSVSNLSQRSAIIRSLIEQNQLSIVGAEYDIVSGQVDFF